MTNEEMLILLFFSPVLLAQSIFLFIDAKRRNTYAWFWGIWGLFQFPLPTIFYWFFVIRRQKKRLRKD